MREAPFPELRELFAERRERTCILCGKQVEPANRLACKECKPEYMRLYFAARMAAQRRLYPNLARNGRDGSSGPRKRPYRPRDLDTDKDRG